MRPRRRLTTRPTKYTPSNTLELASPIKEEQLLSLISNPRNGFCVQEPNRVLISLDYSGQEILIATVLSQDPKMTEAQLAPKKLVRKDGTEYVNPNGDLHTLTTAMCTHPHLVKGLSLDMWYDTVTKKEPGAKRKPRDLGKTLNFAMLYLSSAKSISERNHVKMEVAEQWVKGHMETYPGYYAWAEEYGNISAARGFAIVPYTNSLRWVAEERSGGREGDSAVRSSVNAAVQGSAAYQTKKSMLLIQEAIDKGELKDVEIVGQCHDEILIYAPGTSEVDWDKTEIKDGVITELTFKNDKQSEAVTEKILKIMEDVQTNMFRALGSEIKGACSHSIAPVWAH